ncbi:MAG: type IX secretion system outer membrane channel protein PorV [Saprospiraceae bacterium]
MKIVRFTAFLLFTYFLIQNNTFAQGAFWEPNKGCVVDANFECIPNTLLTATPFLTIVPDARSGGMGDAGVAITPDANSLHFNISKLAFVNQETELSVTYTPWLRNLGLSDVYMAYLGGYKKIDDISTVAGALRFFSLGDINFTDINGAPTGTGKPRELELTLGYARKLSPNLSAGIAGKFINSNLASGQEVNGIPIKPGNAFAADISFTYTSNEHFGFDGGNLSAALSLTNLGSRISYTSSSTREFLPGSLTFGAAFKMEFDEFNTFTVALDINKLLVPTPIPVDHPDYETGGDPDVPDYREKSTFGGIFGSFADAPGGFSEEIQEFSTSLGFEYWYANQFAVRAGYYYEHPLKGDRQFITLGVGLKYNVFGLDISYLAPTNTRRSPLDNTLRFTFRFNVGEADNSGNN